MSQVLKREISGILLFAFVLLIFSPCFQQPLFAIDGAPVTPNKQDPQDQARVKRTVGGAVLGGMTGYALGSLLAGPVCTTAVVAAIGCVTLIPFAVIGGIVAYNSYQDYSAKAKDKASQATTKPIAPAKSSTSGSSNETTSPFKDGAEVKIEMKVGK
ncbi:MAG: hypothetical protein WA705_26380 [Candidatus Ozemobacteraceae bacterium]